VFKHQQLVESYVRQLGLMEYMKLAKFITKQIIILGLLDGKQPSTIAIVSVYVIVKVLKLPITVASMQRISEKSRDTIVNTYDLLKNDLAQIVPPQFLHPTSPYIVQKRPKRVSKLTQLKAIPLKRKKTKTLSDSSDESTATEVEVE